MIVAATLFIVGMLLSAFFSGSETGMYRVSRIRIVLDALAGGWAARGIVWLLNHSAVFVATVLVGNNLANYVTSLSIVLAVQASFAGGAGPELLCTILATPVIFVLGELLPKYLFYNAPYRLLKVTRPLLLTFTIAFLPVSLLLGLLASVLRRLTGETPFRVRLGMAQRELQQVLREGHEAGLLAGSQRTLAQNVFEVGNQPAVRFGMPLQRMAIVDHHSDVAAARSAARRQGHPIVLLENRKQITGFVFYADLLDTEAALPEPIPTIEAQVDDKHLAVLLRLYEENSDVALLRDAQNKVKSVVTRRQLQLSLLGQNVRG